MPMRKLLFILLFGVSAASAADESGTPDAVQRLASAGAPQLALNRVEQSQPRDAAAPRWADWEILRLQLLFQLDRYADVLQRASALPASMPAAPGRVREADPWGPFPPRVSPRRLPRPPRPRSARSRWAFRRGPAGQLRGP